MTKLLETTVASLAGISIIVYDIFSARSKWASKWAQIKT